MNHYILDANGDPVPEPDYLAWARWFETSVVARRVDQTNLANGVMVSTVFLGIDHRQLVDGPPILYETLVFGGIMDGEGQRYATRAEARCGHEEMVSAVLNAKG